MGFYRGLSEKKLFERMIIKWLIYSSVIKMPDSFEKISTGTETIQALPNHSNQSTVMSIQFEFTTNPCFLAVNLRIETNLRTAMATFWCSKFRSDKKNHTNPYFTCFWIIFRMDKIFVLGGQIFKILHNTGRAVKYILPCTLLFNDEKIILIHYE